MIINLLEYKRKKEDTLLQKEIDRMRDYLHDLIDEEEVIQPIWPEYDECIMIDTCTIYDGYICHFHSIENHSINLVVS